LLEVDVVFGSGHQGIHRLTLMNPYMLNVAPFSHICSQTSAIADKLFTRRLLNFPDDLNQQSAECQKYYIRRLKMLHIDGDSNINMFIIIHFTPHTNNYR
jgi:hypothetical protein